MTASENDVRSLRDTIYQCPLIDNHAHNLLKWEEQEKYPLESITTEAGGNALQDTPHSLAHIRAVKQLSDFYECAADWNAVKKARGLQLREDGPSLVRRCLEGTHMILIDDGLDGSGIFPYDWHSDYTTAAAKRIVRIEHEAQCILQDLATTEPFKSARVSESDLRRVSRIAWQDFESRFAEMIENACRDDEVAGFKSVICYRTGLRIQGEVLENFDEYTNELVIPAFCDFFVDGLKPGSSFRVQDKILNDFLVVKALRLLQRSSRAPVGPKPLQFHTGLGDRDLNLLLSNPAHMQSLIERFPEYPIVLLHSSYPYTREAGYLATVYQNCFLDIGEVFPMLSRQGQEEIVQQSLEQVPTNKILWSTDGHWFPETYYLANLQIRQALDRVLVKGVQEGDFTSLQASKIAENILFNNSNRIYKLHLEEPSYPEPAKAKPSKNIGDTVPPSKLEIFQHFVSSHPNINFVRLQWTDNLAIVRTRLLPLSQFSQQLRTGQRVRITLAATGLLPGDNLSSAVSATGQMCLDPDLASLRPNLSRRSHASVMCSWRAPDGSPVEHCSRSTLSRVVEEAQQKADVSFLLGFEIEIVFFEHESDEAEFQQVKGTHSWSTYYPNQDRFIQLLEEIVSGLSEVGIVVEQFHAEGAPGQFEIVLGPLPPIQAIDTLIFARQAVKEAAAAHKLHATFIPYPVDDALGNGAHAHISLNRVYCERQFFGSVLDHLRSLQAFCLPQKTSYKRVSAGTWGSGAWIGWGTQNREMPLRRIAEGRSEIRFLDGTTNMYLAFAAIIAAGMANIDEDDHSGFKDCPYDPARLSEEERERYGIRDRLTSSVEESLSELKNDKVLKQALGEALVETYTVVKKEEQEMLGNMSDKDQKRWLMERY
ncbi:MAG: hypothetical protein M4579_006003 [Chaenotheca gracillima]|nr:MAG: hypothetical protein M4579_006003 [Chaenotheca gracillima]